jgi:hypothetical protein
MRGKSISRVAVAAVIASACGLLPGDESEKVYLHNTSELAVNVGSSGGLGHVAHRLITNQVRLI